MSFCGGPFVPVTALRAGDLVVKDALCCGGKGGSGGEGEWRFRQCSDGADADNVCNEVEEERPTTE